jgi:AraC-like DNA-binding protein
MMAGQFRMLRCSVAGVEAVEAETCHVFPRHWHDQYGIGVVQRGAQKSLSGRGMVEAGPGDTITVNPGEVHDGMPIGDHGRAWYMLYFDPAVIVQAFVDMREGRSGDYELAHPVLRDGAVARQFLQLYRSMTGSDGDASTLRREELLLGLLAVIVRERGQQAAPLTVTSAIHRVRALIDDEPTAPMDLARLATASGLSRFQVLRGFVRATGLTPHAYLMQRRTDLARRLIAEGALLADAAAASGFADQSHMTRTFVRKYGIPPGAYARAVGGR